MAKDGVTIKSNGAAVLKTIGEFADKFGNAKRPLTAVLSMLYKHFKKMFLLQGPGQWTDLSDAYKDQKENQVGFVYPMFKLEGVLKASLTERKSPFNVATVTNTSLIFGTSVESIDAFPYPSALQEGTNKMPERPFLIITDELLFEIKRIFFRTALKEVRKIKRIEKQNAALKDLPTQEWPGGGL